MCGGLSNVEFDVVQSLLFDQMLDLMSYRACCVH